MGQFCLEEYYDQKEIKKMVAAKIENWMRAENLFSGLNSVWTGH